MPRILLLLAFAASFGLAAAAYWPGLSGGFIFDDFVNLASLGAYGPVDDFRTLALYVTSGIADPTGRPVSVASFLLDARNWPAEPWPFKRTNLLLHLSNGLLLSAVLWRLEAWLEAGGAGLPRLHRGWAAWLGATLWLVHPLFVSTTLYVVQRHAMLPLTFVLVSLLCWDRTCASVARGERRKAWAWCLLGLWPAFALAGLSKANGLLAPLLVLVVHSIAIQPALANVAPALRPTMRRTATVFLLLPSLAVLLAFWLRIPASLDFTGGRSFTLAERLLTQPRVLFEYLVQLFAPRAGGGGVFVEGFAKSTSLVQPWTTMPSMLGLAALLGLTWWLRRRSPALSLALAFYFVAHLMESSALMLELYFEHRNYLPAVLLFWPLARWIVGGRMLGHVRPWLAVALPLILLMLTWQRATVWGDPMLLAAVSAAGQPESIRARVVSATELGRAADPTGAIDQLRDAVRQHGAGTDVVFNLVGQECRTGALSTGTDGAMLAALRAERVWHSLTIRWMRSALGVAAEGTCRGLNSETTGRWLDEMERNPSASNSGTKRQNLLHLRAVWSLNAGYSQQALELFDRALETEPNPDTALSQAAILGRAGFPELGLRHLDAFERLPRQPLATPRNMQALHRYILLSSSYHAREIEHLRRALTEAATDASKIPASGEEGG